MSTLEASWRARGRVTVTCPAQSEGRTDSTVTATKLGLLFPCPGLRVQVSAQVVSWVPETPSQAVPGSQPPPGPSLHHLPLVWTKRVLPPPLVLILQSSLSAKRPAPRSCPRGLSVPLSQQTPDSLPQSQLCRTRGRPLLHARRRVCALVRLCSVTPHQARQAPVLCELLEDRAQGAAGLLSGRGAQ